MGVFQLNWTVAPGIGLMMLPRPPVGSGGRAGASPPGSPPPPPPPHPPPPRPPAPAPTPSAATASSAAEGRLHTARLAGCEVVSLHAVVLRFRIEPVE